MTHMSKVCNFKRHVIKISLPESQLSKQQWFQSLRCALKTVPGFELRKVVLLFFKRGQNILVT